MHKALHQYGVEQKFRWDRHPFFVQSLHQLFSIHAHTAWTLCVGYPSERPWIQEVRSTYSWDDAYSQIFKGQIPNTDIENMQLLVLFGSSSQLVEVLHRLLPYMDEYHQEFVQCAEMIFLSPKIHDDIFMYGMAYMGELHLWREGLEDMSADHLWNNPQLVELSTLRNGDIHAQHPAFPELLFMDSAHQWAEYMVMKHKAENVLEPVRCDLSLHV